MLREGQKLYDCSLERNEDAPAADGTGRTDWQMSRLP